MMLDSPISYTIYPELKCVYVQVSGYLRAEHIIRYVYALSEDPIYQDGFDELVDLLAVTEYAVDFNEMRDIVETDKDVSKDKRLSRCALVSDQDFVFGMLRMYQMLSMDSGVEIATFRSLKDAAAWLEKPELVK